MLVGILTTSGQWALAAAPSRLPDCESTCDSETSCGLACEYPSGESWIFTTCGEFNGGGSSYCDGNTCEDMCGPHAPAAWECWIDFELSSCYEQENYAVCGDDVCAWYYGAESWVNCEEDCGPEPPVCDCPNTICDPGENWLNCPDDCQMPGGGTCPNGICDETPSTCPEDCDAPGMSCRNFPCPEDYTCVNDQCVANNASFAFCLMSSPNCAFGTYCVASSSGSGSGRCMPIVW